ncbi:uncharacterized protein KD926_011547 [Aspergillus affinis]|uniref:uncharacterized protein n=1 Tax=Aspergillus affinis TaxID=1070780 RepID=UPI0022FDE5A8|nr:uncharacterized protein KD926_011547 [Aspergillus affinis]KAI9037844.1 hypothetical protein KD926_011547 [Aspergillus affinis]
MAVADYKKYLAENVLNERRTVTYRSLSRALRVHCTLAKQMLYDFHHSENTKKPNSVNATYLLTGIQKPPIPPTTNGAHANGDDNEDDVMASSPYLPSSMLNQDSIADDVATVSVILAREEDLEDAKDTFQSITSIYVYSLQPTILQDLNVLTDVGREMISSHANEDPLKFGKQWGMIQNKHVKRRTGARPPAPAPTPAPAPAPASSKPVVPSKRSNEASQETNPEPKQEDRSEPTQPSQRSNAPSSKPTEKPTEKPGPVKREKSNLFSSFAKAKPKQKKEDSTPATFGADSAEPGAPEDVVLDDASEEEAEELFPDTGKSSSAGTRETRKEREARLKQMMEDEDEEEDEEMPDVPEPAEESNPIDEAPPKPPSPKEEVTVGGGRRRGRRQIMQKKTVRDDEGYLVTVEEPSWESFSEDEPAPPPKKKPAVSASKGKAGASPLPWAQGVLQDILMSLRFFDEHVRTMYRMLQCHSRTLPLLSLVEDVKPSRLTFPPSAPYSEGPLKLPFQRPATECRTFSSPAVEQVIEDVTSRMKDKDLARLFQNAFPNTLDTTVRWHVDGTSSVASKAQRDASQWQGAHTFIVTGDINAEWLRDSTNQLTGYQALAKKDKKLYSLILGAINTQAEFVIQSPYCNAFQPPPPSGLEPTTSGQDDQVHPAYESSVVFECKYELDSLAHFLALGTEFYENTKSTEFLTTRWYSALNTVLKVLDAQSQPTFNDKGQYVVNQYTFQRKTTLGTETLSLAGVGNPLNHGTGLIRSAFRPSDDATILGFFIPPNAQMAVQLKKTAKVLRAAGGKDELAKELEERGDKLDKAIKEHGIVNHAKYGDVYAFEVDGYGSRILMDDANIPSLLSLPYLGYVSKDDKVYQNTRKMLLEKDGNPYYLTGSDFHGIGGPHIGLQNAWPMSLLIQAMTSDSDVEITKSINLVRNSSLLGLVHESINVNNIKDYSRPWFAWANSVFAQTILKVAAERPHLLFGEGADPYIIE